MLRVILTVQVVAIAALFAMILYISFQRPSQVKLQMVLLALSTMLMMIGYLIEILAGNVETAMAGACFSYVGKPFIMLSSTLFVAQYCGYRLPRKWIAVLALYLSLFTVLVFTNPFHHLFYSSVGFDRSRTYSPLVLGHGPAYYIYMCTIAAYFIANTVMALLEYRRTITPEGRHQTLFILGLPLMGVLGFLVYFSGITKGYDATMAGCTVATALHIVLFFKYRLFDVLTLSKEQALDGAYSGLLVLDTRGNIVYANAMVKRLLGGTVTVGEILALPAEESVLHRGGRAYDITRRTIVDRGRSFGETVEIVDITDSFNYAVRLERDVEEKTRGIQHMQRSIIAGFASIVEARDGETGSHIKRTSAYVALIAAGLRDAGAYPTLLTGDFITRLSDVAPLHDIGKITIPDSILLKPGKLTPEEFEIIKGHTAAGVRVIEDTMRGVEADGYVNLAVEIAGSHHEKWDGSGYPAGLAGEEIPLAARIMAAADVYDAVRSQRCYKEAAPPEEARMILRQGSGTHFDPAVVDAFFRRIDDIEAV